MEAAHADLLRASGPLALCAPLSPTELESLFRCYSIYNYVRRLLPPLTTESPTTHYILSSRLLPHDRNDGRALQPSYSDFHVAWTSARSTRLPVLPEAHQLTMVIEHVSRHLIKTVRQKPLFCAAVAATSALVAYLMWAEEEEEEEALARVRSLSDVYPGALQAPKSFTVTNERGELRGQVDETASSWSWFVEEEQWALRSNTRPWPHVAPRPKAASQPQHQPQPQPQVAHGPLEEPSGLAARRPPAGLQGRLQGQRPRRARRPRARVPPSAAAVEGWL